MTDWLSRWGYLDIFVCVFVGNLGIPIPEELVLLAAGFLAGRHTLAATVFRSRAQ
jgi:membrane protein DedA with SNARE-associated domain